MNRMESVSGSLHFERSWGEITRNRMKHLFCELTSFKNLVGLGFIWFFFVFDHLESWPFVAGMSMFLVAKEAKELLSIWKGGSNVTSK